MRRKKAVRDTIMAGKTSEKGLLIVHSGKGKGKSTAAFGLVMRALGHGFRVGVAQFLKGAREAGERRFLSKFPDLVTLGAESAGFTWETQNRVLDIESAERVWSEACALLCDPSYNLVLLDELHVALRYGYLSLSEVMEVLRGRPEVMHVITTGRNAPAELIQAADLVTEMLLVKHPFSSGMKAQAGVEF